MKKIVALFLCFLFCVGSFAFAEDNWTCPNCGLECTWNFCPDCGTKKPTDWTCPNCGVECTSIFCQNCGNRNPSTPVYKAGDTVTMGTWGGEAIEWQVMEVKADGTCVLMSVKGLDAKPYNTEYTGVTWETCTLRSWLNGEFYEKAFSSVEKGKIKTVTVENPDNKTYGTKGGNTTQDKVYLLSLDEVGRYFNIDPYGDDPCAETLICMPTNTAKQNGAYTNNADACWWWLRSPGVDRYYAAFVGAGGGINYYGSVVLDTSDCVRPVVCVRL